MRFVALLLIAGTAVALPGADAAPTRGSRSIFTTAEMIDSGTREKDGSVWFTTWDKGPRFVIPQGNPESGERLWGLLQRSTQEMRSITVTFNVAGASYNPATASIDFPLCSARMDDIVFTSAKECTDEPLSTDKLSTPMRVALAWAQVAEGAPVDSKPLLDSALADPALPRPLQMMALTARADLNERYAREGEPSSEASDRALIAALADNRRLAALEPDNSEHRFSEAADLLALGDYAGAEALYGEILKKWPDEAYQVTVRRAALARLNGDYQPSLDLLNSLAADTSGDLGMKFYYHRGWTLMKLDRFDEAIADFTKGMNSQPEYAWAYILRACSYASVGQLRYAAGDFDEAAGLFEALPASKASTKLKHDIALAKSTANLLRERADTTVVTPVTGLCDDFWDGSDRSRTRSRFLEAQVTTRD